MDNLWFLTEERPKSSVILQIIKTYCNDFNDKIIKKDKIKIKPLIKNNIFTFTYKIEGIRIKNVDNLFIKTVTGSSSFLDFLIFKQKNEPIEGGKHNNLLMGIEETKTSDEESRNTGVYQRGTKFEYIKYFYKNIKLYMLYNDELNTSKTKQPTDTSIFGTNILLTLGIKIIGKDTSKWFKKFQKLEDLIEFKSKMKKAHKGNVPIEITKYDDHIEISGRLAKPGKDNPNYNGNIGHDPNIGALSMISACIRKLGWQKEILITLHEVKQEYVDNKKNKFLYICQLHKLKLDGIKLPVVIEPPKNYWHYEKKSEKITSILLHIAALYSGLYGVYENHAGCERGYFRDKQGTLFTLPKKDRNNKILYIPDLILYDKSNNIIILIEGKKLSNLKDGLAELKLYDSIENEFIKKYYPNATVYRYVSIFGGVKQDYLNLDVLIYVNNKGEIFLNPNAPESIKASFAVLN